MEFTEEEIKKQLDDYYRSCMEFTEEEIRNLKNMSKNRDENEDVDEDDGLNSEDLQNIYQYEMELYQDGTSTTPTSSTYEMQNNSSSCKYIPSSKDYAHMKLNNGSTSTSTSSTSAPTSAPTSASSTCMYPRSRGYQTSSSTTHTRSPKFITYIYAPRSQGYTKNLVFNYYLKQKNNFDGQDVSIDDITVNTDNQTFSWGEGWMTFTQFYQLNEANIENAKDSYVYKKMKGYTFADTPSNVYL